MDGHPSDDGLGGRDAVRRRAWPEAYEPLSTANAAGRSSRRTSSSWPRPPAGLDARRVDRGRERAYAALVERGDRDAAALAGADAPAGARGEAPGLGRERLARTAPRRCWREPDRSRTGTSRSPTARSPSRATRRRALAHRASARDRGAVERPRPACLGLMRRGMVLVASGRSRRAGPHGGGQRGGGRRRARCLHDRARCSAT